MKTFTRTNARGTRTRKVVVYDSIFEDWARDDETALLHYHEDAPGSRVDRFRVAIRWPFNLEKDPLVWRFATIEEARGCWREARLYLETLGFARVK